LLFGIVWFFFDCLRIVCGTYMAHAAFFLPFCYLRSCLNYIFSHAKSKADLSTILSATHAKEESRIVFNLGRSPLGLSRGGGNASLTLK
jgi:hypothetical protein